MTDETEDRSNDEPAPHEAPAGRQDGEAASAAGSAGTRADAAAEDADVAPEGSPADESGGDADAEGEDGRSARDGLEARDQEEGVADLNERQGAAAAGDDSVIEEPSEDLDLDDGGDLDDSDDDFDDEDADARALDGSPFADEMQDDLHEDDEPQGRDMAEDRPGAGGAGALAAAASAGERIAKVMARAGVASRREAERMILEGRVTVNGRVIASPALDVLASDKVRVDGQPLEAPQETRLWMYYKPLGLVTSEADEKGRQTVFDALPRDLPRVMTVGRLDLNSEGLLLLTNDGELKRRLELPATGWLRRYRVRVNGQPNDLTFDPLRRGISIDGEDFAPMEIRLDSQQGANAWLTVGIREGRNREIRRAMAQVGLQVNRLIRIAYGPFRLTGMEPNEVREIKRRVLRDQLGGLLTGTEDDAADSGERRDGAGRGRPARPGARPNRGMGTSGEGRHPRGGFGGGPGGERARDRDEGRTAGSGFGSGAPARRSGPGEREDRGVAGRPRFDRNDRGPGGAGGFARRDGGNSPAETEAPRKSRWSRDERNSGRRPPREDRGDEARAGRDTRYAGQPQDGGGRGSRADRPSAQRPFGDRPRPGTGPDQRGERQPYAGRPQAERRERNRGDRPQRPGLQHEERPSGRFAAKGGPRGPRPAREEGDRSERPRFARVSEEGRSERSGQGHQRRGEGFGRGHASPARGDQARRANPRTEGSAGERSGARGGFAGGAEGRGARDEGRPGAKSPRQGERGQDRGFSGRGPGPRGTGPGGAGGKGPRGNGPRGGGKAPRGPRPHR